jgi:hypothetical protein
MNGIGIKITEKEGIAWLRSWFSIDTAKNA